jgi:serine/threonine protein kinase
VQPGDVIDDRFEIERVAATGKTAAVYRALDRRTEGHAAIKVVADPGAEASERFAREASLLEGLRHPDIVRTLAHGRTAGGDPYVAMEWLEGEDLGARLANGELTAVEAVRIALKAASALAAAHARRIVHADLGLASVFLVDFRVDAVRLIGFGIGRPAAAQAGDDVRALGAVLFRCLTGRDPPPGPARARDIVPELPAALDDLVERMLARDAERPAPDAAAALAELRTLGKGLGARVTPSVLADGPTEPAPPRGAPAALTGRTLGDFVAREKIGEGGFADVYRAEQPLLGREAVIKVLHGKLLTRELYVQRFLREARLASKLDHPYAAHIYAFGVEPDGQMWIAMELVRGTPLSQLLRQGPIPLERFVPLLDRICEVVHSAHEAGIVHRDIKPANVMVIARAGRMLPKLLDFGIAKLHDDPAEPGRRAAVRDSPPGDGAGELTQDGTALGSPSYMAPEQWSDAATADARSDLYALGVLAFECLTGRTPFGRGDRMVVARAHARDHVPPLPPELPPALDAVMAKAMAKDPNDRYGDALAFAAAFREASGLTADAETLPKLDETLRQSAVADAPQPIAEAVAALEGARHAHQAREALWEVVHVVIRFLGLCALACRTRVVPGSDSDSPAVTEMLRSLRGKDLGEGEWLKLTRELVRPFATKLDAYPIPELAALFVARGAQTLADPLVRLAALRDGEVGGSISQEEQVRDELAHLLPELALALRAVTFLSDYRLVVPGADGAEAWMGIRRGRRASIALRGPPLPDGQPILADSDGRPILSLAPIMQVAPPTPGAPAELFLFEGRGRLGARLVAMPHGLERQDEDVWEWFRKNLAADSATAAEMAAPEVAPYRGLSAFTRDDAALFFGRERQVEAFVNRLRAQPLIAVVGPSGAGKSSFVQAGVVPTLGHWRTITVRPGPAPVAALSARLAQENIAAPATDAGALGAALRAASASHLLAILLVIDQFEELFTLCQDPAERLLFAESLAGAARSADDRVRVILTLRDDFLVRAAKLPPLRDRLAQGLQLLTTPAAEDLLRILVEPAHRAGYELDDRDLAARMVQAVADQPGALALLSFTARQLWELRDRHFKQLSSKAYDAMGGVGGALGKHAEETLAGMTAEEQRVVREAFRHLVTAEGTRAVLTRVELRQVLGDSDVADAVVEKLVHARLLLATASWDGSARLWDAASGALRHKLDHAGRVYQVKFSPDGRKLVTPSRDGTAKVWNVATGELLLALMHPAQVDFAEVSPDGQRILTACRDGAVRVWSAEDGSLAATLRGPPRRASSTAPAAWGWRCWRRPLPSSRGGIAC